MKRIKQLKYFELIRELAKTGFKLKYQDSFFGYLWSLMKPLFLFMVLYFVFNFVFKLGKAIPNYPVYLLIGITLWGFFAETTSMCMGSIVGNGDLIRKIYFPRIILPIATSLTSFISLLLNMVVVFGFLAYAHVSITAAALLLPFYLIELYIFTLGVSFFLSSLFVKFRDMGPIWEVAAQTLFYATPILYSVATINYHVVVKLMMINPLAQIFQGVRAALLGGSVITSASILGRYFLLPYIVVIFVFVLGYGLFQKMAAKFAEEV